MKGIKSRFLVACMVAALSGSLASGIGTTPYLSLMTEEDWYSAGEEHIRPMMPDEWDDFWNQYNDPAHLEGEPYPPTTFYPANLYVWTCDPCFSGGGAGSCPDYETTGLVMSWGDPEMPEGQAASAWVYEYLEDPDLSNASVTVQVEAPCGISRVSFGLEDAAGNIRAWYWNVGNSPGRGQLQCSPDPSGWPVRTTITVNVAQTGTKATTPAAFSYSSAPGFNPANVTQFKYDEDANWVAASWVPPPGQPDLNPWNYWFNLMVTPNPPPVESKFSVKWSQPPVWDACDPNFINGWDEWSLYYQRPIMADDWKCTDDRPVTDIHWWGSFWRWDMPKPPPVVPQAFHIGIWTDVPAGDPCNEDPFSHPGIMIWENYCDNWVWEFIAYDKDPWQVTDINDSCFQFTQLLSQDEWFFQEPNAPWDRDGDPNSAVFWLSISAIYDPCKPYPQYPWGWKTRPHHWNDDAVFIWDTKRPNIDWNPPIPPNWPPQWGWEYVAGEELQGPDASWDLAFELTTKEPDPNPPPPSMDFDGSGIVDFRDFAIFAAKWLTSGV